MKLNEQDIEKIVEAILEKVEEFNNSLDFVQGQFISIDPDVIEDCVITALRTVTLESKQVDLREVLDWATKELKEFNDELESDNFRNDEIAIVYLRGVNLGCRSILKDVVEKLTTLSDLNP